MVGPFSPGVQANGIIWLSGQVAPDAGSTGAQTTAALKIIDELLAKAGATKNGCFNVQILLDDIRDFDEMNQAYAAWTEGIKIKPVRAAYAVGALPLQSKVEIIVQCLPDISA